MGIDYEKLIEPYSDPTPPANTAAKRTTVGQKAWLLKRGIPEGIADDSIRSVYSELAAGRVFDAMGGFPAGYHLDRHLLETARELQRKSGPPRLEINADDMASVAAFSRDALKAAFWKGIAIGAAVGATAGGLAAWRLMPFLS